MQALNNRLDQKAFYNEHSPRMFSTCLKYSRTREDAEDALQIGFVKVFLNLHTFRGEGSFDGWLRHIFRNESIVIWRKRSSVYEPLDVQNVDKSETGLQILYKKDLEKQIESLDPGYRNTFKLYLSGYSHKEIGKIMGVTDSTSKSQYSRAKASLRRKAA